MTTNETLARPSRIRPVALPGRLLLVGGLLGMIVAVVIIGWPHDVPSSRFSYPFTANDFVIAQLALFVQGLPLMLGLLTLAASGGLGSVRGTRIGLYIASGGLAVLEVLQIVAIAAKSTASDSTLANTLHVVYLAPPVLLAAGAITAGVALRRTSPAVGPTWLPWLLIAIGTYVIVPMSPMLAGPFIVGQLALGGLMLLFAVLGGLLQSSRS
jgi:hypothetical protein